MNKIAVKRKFNLDKISQSLHWASGRDKIIIIGLSARLKNPIYAWYIQKLKVPYWNWWLEKLLYGGIIQSDLESVFLQFLIWDRS